MNIIKKESIYFKRLLWSVKMFNYIKQIVIKEVIYIYYKSIQLNFLYFFT